MASSISGSGTTRKCGVRKPPSDALLSNEREVVPKHLWQTLTSLPISERTRQKLMKNKQANGRSGEAVVAHQEDEVLNDEKDPWSAVLKMCDGGSSASAGRAGNRNDKSFSQDLEIIANASMNCHCAREDEAKENTFKAENKSQNGMKNDRTFKKDTLAEIANFVGKNLSRDKISLEDVARFAARTANEKKNLASPVDARCSALSALPASRYRNPVTHQIVIAHSDGIEEPIVDAIHKRIRRLLPSYSIRRVPMQVDEMKKLWKPILSNSFLEGIFQIVPVGARGPMRYKARDHAKETLNQAQKELQTCIPSITSIETTAITDVVKLFDLIKYHA